MCSGEEEEVCNMYKKNEEHGVYNAEQDVTP